MTSQEIGRYKVGDDELVLTVPDDEISRLKINAVCERMEKAEADEDPEMVLHCFAILLGVLLNRSTEEVSEMIPAATVHEMMHDFHQWVSCLRPVRTC